MAQILNYKRAKHTVRTRPVLEQKPSKLPRRVYHVVPGKNGWTIKVGGTKVCTRFTKASAVSDAVSMAKSDWRKGRVAQVKVHLKNGKIQIERTYGRDPRRYKS